MSERIGGKSIVVFVLVCVFGSSVFLLVSAHNQKGAERLFSFDPSNITVRVENTPRFLHDEVEASLRSSFREGVSFSLKAGQGVMLARSLLLDCGWVKEVEEVAISDKGRLTARVRLRCPFAWLKRGDVFQLLDVEGKELPHRASFAEAARSRLLIIRGLDDPIRIRAALSLCRVVYENEKLLANYGVRILFLERASSGRYNLISTDGRVFEWGYPPTGRTTPYLTVKEKMRNMVMVLKNPLSKKSGRVVLWTRVSVDAVQEPPQD